MSSGINSIIGVGAVVIRPDGAVLLGHRNKPGEPATWCLPGGHVEPGESFETAALREIQEETGIGQLDRPRVFAITQHLDGPAAMVTAGVAVHVVRADILAQVREPHVFSQWDWFGVEALPTPLFPATAAVLACWRNAQTPAGWCSYAIAGMARS